MKDRADAEEEEEGVGGELERSGEALHFGESLAVLDRCDCTKLLFELPDTQFRRSKASLLVAIVVPMMNKPVINLSIMIFNKFYRYDLNVEIVHIPGQNVHYIRYFDTNAAAFVDHPKLFGKRCNNIP